MKVKVEGLDAGLKQMVVELLEKSKNSKSLSQPNIYGWEETDNGNTIEVSFDDSDSIKIVTLFGRIGLRIS